MKAVYRIFCLASALSIPFAAAASPEDWNGDQTPNPEITPMAFSQCIDVIHTYESDLGPAQVILDAPGLRIVQFRTNKERAQISCDGGESLMSVFDPDDE